MYFQAKDQSEDQKNSLS